jgi:GcrA cell cycle regulator
MGNGFCARCYKQQEQAAMNWTDERVELLRKLWSEGLSASQIAAHLGGVSRNAVIGKVHRLKLSSRARATSTAPRPKRAPRASSAPRTSSSRPHGHSTIGATALKQQFYAEPVAERQLRPIENIVVPIARKLTLIQLNDKTCKWPIGDPLTEEFHFCGNDSGESSPYCAYHARLAFQPSIERRRAR